MTQWPEQHVKRVELPRSFAHPASNVKHELPAFLQRGANDIPLASDSLENIEKPDRMLGGSN
jgi:hypothetical protein